MVSTEAAEREALSPALIGTFAVACGCAVGNLYFSQPLLGVIGQEFHIKEAASAAIVTMTQLGYASGLLLLAPLGDLIENRRLVTTVFSAGILALLAAASAPSYAAFLAASLAIGMTSVVAQILVPFAAHLAPPERRGLVVGQIISGILTGILTARAVAGFISASIGWRGAYLVSAAVIVILVLTLRHALPQRRPEFTESYGKLLRSLGHLYLTEPVMRRRGFYQAAMFGAFSAFWTSITFLLSAPPYRFSQRQIGLFALAGAAGALFASVAGKLGDRGYSRAATGSAIALGGAAFALTLLQNHLWALLLGAIALDMGANTGHVLSQHMIFALNPAARSRLNTLYMTMFFLGGAASSALAGLAYSHGGWPSVVVLGTSLPAVAFLYWLTEPKPAAR